MLVYNLHLIYNVQLIFVYITYRNQPVRPFIQISLTRKTSLTKEPTPKDVLKHTKGDNFICETGYPLLFDSRFCFVIL